MSNWFHHDHHGRRGRSQLYTDQTICTFLMLKGIFSLTLRATQVLLDSLFELMNVPLCAPDYSCVSKRARTVKVTYRQPAKGGITDLVIDSTGLKVFGEGEWKARKHCAEKRRVWRKLHLVVDPVTHDIVAAEISLAETAMYRFKQLLAGKISLRNYNGQVGEVMVYVSAINQLNTLGLPVRKPRV
jgi:hypothetical protein